jgi:hypothetical protein
MTLVRIKAELPTISFLIITFCPKLLRLHSADSIIPVGIWVSGTARFR